jgi:long-chain acyl-CoA synthetase
MISHGNFIAAISGSMGLNTKINIKPGDRYLSYLPLAHIYERLNIMNSIYTGLQVFFFSGDILNIKKDIIDCKPSVFPSVPRMYNRIYDGIKAAFDRVTGLKKALINRAIKTKLYNLRTFGLYTHGIYDPLIFNPIKATMGGEVRAFICGSAPLSGEIADMIKICFSCPLIEGF